MTPYTGTKQRASDRSAISRLAEEYDRYKPFVSLAAWVVGLGFAAYVAPLIKRLETVERGVRDVKDQQEATREQITTTQRQITGTAEERAEQLESMRQDISAAVRWICLKTPPHDRALANLSDKCINIPYIP